jgi:hypothetical protein
MPPFAKLARGYREVNAITQFAEVSFTTQKSMDDNFVAGDEGMRTFFAIAVAAAVLALMPAPPESERAKLALVTPELANVCGFSLCETAVHAAENLEAKARFGAHIVIEWANTASGRIGAKLPADLA